LAEIFLNGGRAGSDADAAASDAAITASLALQHGTSIDVITAGRCSWTVKAGPHRRWVPHLTSSQAGEELRQGTSGPMSALGGSGRAASKEEVRVDPDSDTGGPLTTLDSSTRLDNHGW
jgi:hypothetical protein